MYPDYHEESRDFLLYFLQKYFPDNEGLATSIYPLEQSYDENKFAQLLEGLDFKEGYKVLTQFVRENGENVPPRSEEHTSELQSRPHLVCRLLLEKKKQIH